MPIELAAALGALALIDSLSVGTLLIPIFFLVAPGRVRAGRMLLYLGTIATFYFALGLALAAGAGVAVTGLGEVLETPAARVGQLAIGAGLLVWSFFIGRARPTRASVGAGVRAGTAKVAAWADGRSVPAGGRSDASAAGTGTAGGARTAGAGADAAATDAGGGGRLARWRDRAMGDGPVAAVVVLALAAGLVEAATMLPYLGAIGLITASGLPAATWWWVLAAYCLVMIVPALLLLGLRVAARRLVEPMLARFAAWLQKNSAENTAWIVGIVGFLIARDAAVALELF